MYGVGLAGVPDFVSGPEEYQDPESAWSWLQGIADRYMEIGPAIFDLRHRAAVAGAEAGQAGDDLTQSLAQQTIRRLSDLYDVWDRFSDLAARTRAAVAGGLGAIPWIALGIGGAAALVAAAGTMAYVLARFSAESRIVGLLEDRALTAEEAERLLAETEGGAGFSPLGGTTALVLAGVLAFVLYKGR